jgi:hypothetical protein
MTIVRGDAADEVKTQAPEGIFKQKCLETRVNTRVSLIFK